MAREEDRPVYMPVEEVRSVYMPREEENLIYNIPREEEIPSYRESNRVGHEFSYAIVNSVVLGSNITTEQ